MIIWVPLERYNVSYSGSSCIITGGFSRAKFLSFHQSYTPLKSKKVALSVRKVNKEIFWSSEIIEFFCSRLRWKTQLRASGKINPDGIMCNLFSFRLFCCLLLSSSLLRHLSMHKVMKGHSSYLCHDGQLCRHMLNAFITKENNSASDDLSSAMCSLKTLISVPS